MMTSHPLIILRGNSGCGKTSTARLLQRQLGYGTMLVSQDVVRREILRVKDSKNNPAIQLIYDLCMYGNKVGYTVILEGILSNKLVYYFDISFEETMRRHATKPNAHEFGELEMRRWWKEKDYLDFENEFLIRNDTSQEDLINMILKTMSIK